MPSLKRIKTSQEEQVTFNGLKISQKNFAQMEFRKNVVLFFTSNIPGCAKLFIV